MSFAFCSIMGPDTGRLRNRTSTNHLYTAASTSSYTAVRTRRAPRAPGLLSALSLISALFFKIVLRVLLGILHAAATSDFFSPRSTRFIISSFTAKGKFCRFTLAITAQAHGAKHNEREMQGDNSHDPRARTTRVQEALIGCLSKRCGRVRIIFCRGVTAARLTRRGHGRESGSCAAGLNHFWSERWGKAPVSPPLRGKANFRGHFCPA